ncbi:hypothetical protein J6590_066756 [Homalodisca vitripennis]|nr:hypothetical protein J6590_066756 [Homalodisca vitripennis]
MAERSKSLDFGSELEIAQVQILSVTFALFISTIDLVLYRLFPLFCLIRSSHRPTVAGGELLEKLDAIRVAIQGRLVDRIAARCR